MCKVGRLIHNKILMSGLTPTVTMSFIRPIVKSIRTTKKQNRKRNRQQMKKTKMKLKIQKLNLSSSTPLFTSNKRNSAIIRFQLKKNSLFLMLTSSKKRNPSFFYLISS